MSDDSPYHSVELTDEERTQWDEEAGNHDSVYTNPVAFAKHMLRQYDREQALAYVEDRYDRETAEEAIAEAENEASRSEGG